MERKLVNLKTCECICGVVATNSQNLARHREKCATWKHWLKENMENIRYAVQTSNVYSLTKTLNMSHATIHKLLNGEAVYSNKRKGYSPRKRLMKNPEPSQVTPVSFIDSINQGTFWKEFCKAEQAPEILMLALQKLFETVAAANKTVAEQAAKLDGLKAKIESLLAERDQARQQCEIERQAITSLRHQRDGALVQAAVNAFASPGQ